MFIVHKIEVIYCHLYCTCAPLVIHKETRTLMEQSVSDESQMFMSRNSQCEFYYENAFNPFQLKRNKFDIH